MTCPAAAGNEQDDLRAGTDHLRKRHSEPHVGHEQILGEKLGSVALFGMRRSRFLLLLLPTYGLLSIPLISVVPYASPVLATSNVVTITLMFMIYFTPTGSFHTCSLIPLARSPCRVQPGVLASRGPPDRCDAGKGPPAPRAAAKPRGLPPRRGGAFSPERATCRAEPRSGRSPRKERAESKNGPAFPSRYGRRGPKPEPDSKQALPAPVQSASGRRRACAPKKSGLCRHEPAGLRARPRGLHPPDNLEKALFCARARIPCTAD